MGQKGSEDYQSEIPIPAKTLEGRENQLIDAATRLVEWRIHNGVASAQETVHFLKLGSVRNQLEQEKLGEEVRVLRARIKEMDSRRSMEDVYQKALAAIRGYQGLEPEDYDEDSDEDVY